MQPIPYVFFRNTCREAMTRYGEIFGTDPQIMGAEMMPPEERGDDWPDGTVMHAAVQIGSGWLYASDDPTGAPPVMSGCNIAVALPDAAETRRVWNALAEGGEVRMDLSPTFFAPLYGALSDRFGVRWMVMQDGEPG
ncbi:VOC family protein [Rhodobacterales bacterium HKCCE2091]|nr:VOC family protein [Rhodobacterales bacterium HKCCE2091]